MDCFLAHHALPSTVAFMAVPGFFSTRTSNSIQVARAKKTAIDLISIDTDTFDINVLCDQISFGLISEIKPVFSTDLGKDILVILNNTDRITFAEFDDRVSRFLPIGTKTLEHRSDWLHVSQRFDVVCTAAVEDCLTIMPIEYLGRDQIKLGEELSHHYKGILWQFRIIETTQDLLLVALISERSEEGYSNNIHVFHWLPTSSKLAEVCIFRGEQTRNDSTLTDDNLICWIEQVPDHDNFLLAFKKNYIQLLEFNLSNGIFECIDELMVSDADITASTKFKTETLLISTITGTHMLTSLTEQHKIGLEILSDNSLWVWNSLMHLDGDHFLGCSPDRDSCVLNICTNEESSESTITPVATLDCLAPTRDISIIRPSELYKQILFAMESQNFSQDRPSRLKLLSNSVGVNHLVNSESSFEGIRGMWTVKDSPFPIKANTDIENLSQKYNATIESNIENNNNEYYLPFYDRFVIMSFIGESRVMSVQSTLTDLSDSTAFRTNESTLNAQCVGNNLYCQITQHGVRLVKLSDSNNTEHKENDEEMGLESTTTSEWRTGTNEHIDSCSISTDTVILNLLPNNIFLVISILANQNQLQEQKRLQWSQEICSLHVMDMKKSSNNTHLFHSILFHQNCYLIGTFNGNLQLVNASDLSVIYQMSLTQFSAEHIGIPSSITSLYLRNTYFILVGLRDGTLIGLDASYTPQGERSNTDLFPEPEVHRLGVKPVQLCTMNMTTSEGYLMSQAMALSDNTWRITTSSSGEQLTVLPLEVGHVSALSSFCCDVCTNGLLMVEDNELSIATLDVKSRFQTVEVPSTHNIYRTLYVASIDVVLLMTRHPSTLIVADPDTWEALHVEHLPVDEDLENEELYTMNLIGGVPDNTNNNGPNHADKKAQPSDQRHQTAWVCLGTGANHMHSGRIIFMGITKHNAENTTYSTETSINVTTVSNTTTLPGIVLNIQQFQEHYLVVSARKHLFILDMKLDEFSSILQRHDTEASSSLLDVRSKTRTSCFIHSLHVGAAYIVVSDRHDFLVFFRFNEIDSSLQMMGVDDDNITQHIINEKIALLNDDTVLSWSKTGTVRITQRKDDNDLQLYPCISVMDLKEGCINFSKSPILNDDNTEFKFICGTIYGSIIYISFPKSKLKEELLAIQEKIEEWIDKLQNANYMKVGMLSVHDRIFMPLAGDCVGHTRTKGRCIDGDLLSLLNHVSTEVQFDIITSSLKHLDNNMTNIEQEHRFKEIRAFLAKMALQ